MILSLLHTILEELQKKQTSYEEVCQQEPERGEQKNGKDSADSGETLDLIGQELGKKGYLCQ